MSEAASNRSRNWDLAWYVAGRISAVMIAVTSLGLVVSSRQQVSDSRARAVAVHRQDLAAHQRKVPWTPPLREFTEWAESRP